jgi:hypothetical protein
MRLSELKKRLPSLESVVFLLENGLQIPAHFHVTEVGVVTKHFIDCGGTERFEKVVNFQLWSANDVDHRLKPNSLLKIIELSEQKLDVADLEIEVEFQTDTIGKYDLDFKNSKFILKAKKTACLALDLCCLPNLAEIIPQNIGCTPGGGCC